MSEAADMLDEIGDYPTNTLIWIRRYKLLLTIQND
jgi:hypothetical protein